MIKKYTIALATIFLLSFNFLIAQVGIGTTNPDPSAALDITSTNSGLLIPRVALNSITDTNTINGTEAESLLVYNTAVINDVTQGFYYWNGSRWVRFSTDAWSINGNAGTNANSNFLGTIDAQDLAIRTNNIEVLRVTQPNTMTNDPMIIAGNGLNHGNINNPLYTLSSDLDTGIWSDNGDELSIGAGGREFITLDENTTSQDELIFNDRGQNIDFRLEGINEENVMFVNASNNRIGFYTNNPGTDITVGGSNTEVRIEAFNEINNPQNNGIDPAPVYANADGTLTLQGPLIQNKMIINNTNASSNATVITVNANQDPQSGLILSEDFTLTQRSLVEVIIQVGCSISDRNGNAIIDGAPRIFGSFAEINGTRVAVTSATYTTRYDPNFGTPDPNTGIHTLANGYYYLNAHGYVELPAGSYTVNWSAYIWGGSFATRASFGNSGAAAGVDKIQVIVHN